MNRTRIIKVSQEKLEEIVREVIKEYLEAIQSKETNFRIEGDIPDVSELIRNMNFSNKDLIQKKKDSVNEGLIQTYDANKVKDIVCRKFNLVPQQFHIEPITDNGTTVNLIAILLNSRISKSEIGDIINLMRTCGYFEYSKPFINGPFITYFFEPHYSKDITSEIKQKYQYLYHAAPSIYVQKILKNGLVPRHRNTLFFYPSRVYCMRGNNLSSEQIGIIKNVQAQRGTNTLHDDNRYTILIIDVSEIPDNVKFFVDPNAKNAILTHNNIPPRAISVYGELQ